MTSRVLRYALAMLSVGVLGIAAYVTWTEESQIRTTTARARAFDAHSQSVTRALFDIKSAQPGYVAAGQGADFWTAKTDRLLAPVRDGLAALRIQARTAQARLELETAAAAFEDFEQMDRRAREYTRSGQRLLASDLVFSDGLEKIEATVAALDRAREAEASTSEADLLQRRRTQWIAGVGAAALTLLVLYLLTPLPEVDQAPLVAPTSEPEPAADYPIASGGALPEPQPAPAPGESAIREGTATATADLGAVAALCSDLARVVDMRALPPALERAATLLQASGIIIWVADPDGRELVPVISHGYPPRFLTRLGNINRDAENVTAAAYRTGLVQTVRAAGDFPGAIAAPLPTPSGPVGVMAAEILNEGEQHDQTLALAAIVAAQLATLMAPPVRSQGKAEVAG